MGCGSSAGWVPTEHDAGRVDVDVHVEVGVDIDIAVDVEVGVDI